jgi:general secretion pathway protein G
MIKKFNKGFSLIELLVVISIIGILLAVLVTNFMGARERAKDSQKVQDMVGLKNALRMYYNDNQAYPTPASNMVGVGISGYYPGIVSVNSVGYTYAISTDSDSFSLCTTVTGDASGDAINSQLKCGRNISICGMGIVDGVGVTAANLFAVCSN